MTPERVKDIDDSINEREKQFLEKAKNTNNDTAKAIYFLAAELCEFQKNMLASFLLTS